MSEFDDPSGAAHFEAPAKTPTQVALERVSDDELLLECRRRNLLVRVTANTIAPGRFVADGYPMDDQILSTYRELAVKLTSHHMMGLQPRGCKWSEGFFDPIGRSFLGASKERQLEVVLNYVVERGK